MRSISPDLAAHIAAGVTTLAHCWKVTLSGGTVLGFTDHDRTLSFGGVDYEPESGFTGSDMDQSLGLAVDTSEVEGVLSSDLIKADDLALGVWDNAAVEVWLIDWSDVSKRVLLRKTSIGEVSRLGKIGFKAELRGLAHALDQETGRTYQRQCDVKDLGDARCEVDLGTLGYIGAGTVTAVDDDRVIYASGLGIVESGWFSYGNILWQSGLNAGVTTEVRAHSLVGTTAVFTLWRRAALPVAVGDTFYAVVGCDRTFATCQAKFDNIANFRGFPHISGNDFALGVAKSSEENDGGSFFNE